MSPALSLDGRTPPPRPPTVGVATLERVRHVPLRGEDVREIVVRANRVPLGRSSAPTMGVGRVLPTSVTAFMSGRRQSRGVRRALSALGETQTDWVALAASVALTPWFGVQAHALLELAQRSVAGLL